MTLFLLARIGLLLVVAYYCILKVTLLRDTLEAEERHGLGIMAGGCILTMAAALDPTGPFEGWAAVVPAFGLFLFIRKRVNRDLAHLRRNAEQARRSRDYLIRRGKL